MGASDRDIELEPHQLGQHLCPAHDRQATTARGGQLNIVVFDSAGDHDNRCIADVIGALADMDGRTHSGETFKDRAFTKIAALHRIAEIKHDFCDAAHADAADADEMNRAEIFGRRCHDLLIFSCLLREQCHGIAAR